jgi:hypothetical protein
MSRTYSASIADLESTPKGLAEFRRARRTRFLADENIEPWAVHVMRRNRLDVLEARQLGLEQRDDPEVFAASWKLRRLLLTHDRDFLDDTRVPYNRCAGLMVLPERLFLLVTYREGWGRWKFKVCDGC